MRRVRLDYEFAHPPEILWRYLTDHEGLIRWTDLERVGVLRAVGEGGVGTLRRMVLALPRGGSLKYDEEIVSAEVERRFEYRIISGLPLTHHYAMMQLDPFGTGTRLIWRKHFALKPKLLESIAGPLVERGMQRSLERLDRLMRAEYAVSGLRLLGRLPSEDEESQLEQARERRERLRELALRFRKADTAHYWFARLFQRLVESLLALVEEGHFIHPGWVVRLTNRLHELYEANLELWEAGRPEQVEEHWHEAFEASEIAPRWWTQETDAAFHALAFCLRAHVSEDWPRALATTFWDAYRDEPGFDYHTFFEDYCRLQPVFEAVRRALMREIPEPGLIEAVTSGELRGLLSKLRGRPLTFKGRRLDLRSERRRTWHRGEALLRLLQDPDGDAGRRFPAGLALRRLRPDARRPDARRPEARRPDARRPSPA